MTGEADSFLFQRLAVESPAQAVVRRIKAAIGLGLLGDGDRLPREADLVRRLGVTAFTVREALATLRSDGLVVTRAGKQGGSFVSEGTGRGALTSGELRRTSLTKLRDLSDWRRMLASVSAHLAAGRASASNIDRLRVGAEALGAASDEAEARRAHGQFHVELAAAAQSARMTREELAMFQEFDWLLGAVFADGQRRRRAGQELAAVAHAVAARMPDEARDAAERHSESIASALVRLRLASVASVRPKTPDHRVTHESVAAELGRLMGLLRGTLTDLAGLFVARQAETKDTAQLRDCVSSAAVRALADPIGVQLDGIGIMARPGLLVGGEYWMAWWKRTSDGVVPDYRHVMDPGRDDFYDYTTHDYFRGPRLTGNLGVEGPYVDYGGTDEYTITLAAPACHGDQFIGVSAADLSVDSLEEQLSPWLVAIDRPCVLLNGEGRVIMTNVADHTIGAVVTTLPGDAAVAPVPALDWTVVIF